MFVILLVLRSGPLPKQTAAASGELASFDFFPSPVSILSDNNNNINVPNT